VFRTNVRTLVAAIVILLGAGLATGTAHARITRCLPPAEALPCDLTTGKVTYVSDGDTFYVDLDDDGSRRTYSIRMTAINAMEQSVYSRIASRRRGECHALEATSRLEQLLRRSRWRVRLYALDPESRSRDRLVRAVAVRVGGRWRDAGSRLMAEGHALWLPRGREWAWNGAYARRAEYAASLQRGLWNPAYCGAGPSDASPLRVTVNGAARFLSEEWVRIRNLDPVNAVPLGGWWVRDSSLKRFVFPDWATLPPGESLTVYAGTGTNTWTEFFWGLPRAVFDNPGPNATGDGAYLFDPQGDLRAWMTYPCVRACADPYVGAVKVGAKPRGSEHVTVTNVATFAVDLDGYALESEPFRYPFPRDSVLQPGETMRIQVQGDPAADTRLEKHWGETGSILKDSGDTISLVSFRGILLDCYAYGTAAC
jgi:endonuclease YncB( thermonuclease family)